jgi:tripartite-type tricarboxylate transporter receptor subunit TctC
MSGARIVSVAAQHERRDGPSRRRVALGLGASMLGLAGGVARAENDYPARLVTIVVPLPAGGTADLLARMVADKLRAALGQQVMVEDRPGGSGGNIGAEYVAHAPADGYTLLNAPQLTFSINHLLNPHLTFDPRAFEPVSVLAAYPTVLFGRANLPVDSFADLIAYARAHPGKLNCGSQGNGQIAHLTLEALKQLAKVNIVHVPYRGSAPAMNDLLGGQIDIVPDTPLTGLPFVRAGKLKMLAVGSRERLKAFPDVPTLAEVVPGLYSDTWMAIAAPPGTPREVTAKLSAAIAKAIRMPDVSRRIVELDAEPLGSTPDEMRELIRQSRERWEPVVTAAKITSE